MTRSLAVHLLPELADAASLTGAAAVVIDVLRATTTIVHALAAGAREVLPCLEVEQARRWAADRPDAVLGGERGGVRIAGFHLGNSPLEYTPATVGGRTVVFTTTNGTRAMQQCRSARRVLLAAFVNLSAVCDRLRVEERVEIVCAGTDQQVTREDVLLAGALAAELTRAAPAEWRLNDGAELAADAWRQTVADFSQPGRLLDKLRNSHGGRNLIEIGQAGDIDLAAQLDRFEIVPELDTAAWRIAAA